MMRASIFMKFVGLLALVWPGPLSATVTAMITGPVDPPPVTFSGTNCGCSGAVTTDVGYITSARLSVGGNIVARYNYQQGEPTHTSVLLTCGFASTHFANGPLQLQVEGSNSQGESDASERDPDQVYNKGVVFVRWDFNLGQNPSHYNKVRQELQAMNHPCQGWADYWSATHVLPLIPPGTAFHVSSHGNVMTGPPPPGIHQAFQEAVQPPGDSGWIKDSQVQVKVQEKTGDPPNYPPYHVVFVNSCSSAGSGNTMAAAFGIPITGGTNQAFIGWKHDEQITVGVTFANYFWEELNQNRTVWGARREAYGRMGWEKNPPEEQHRVVIWGDQWTTLDTNRVYTGTDQAAPNGWYNSSVTFPP